MCVVGCLGCVFVEVGLPVAGPFRLDACALILWLFIFEQYGVGSLSHTGCLFQRGQHCGVVFAELFPEEAELSLQISNRGTGSLDIIQERLLAAPVCPLGEAVACGVTREAGILSGVHRFGVAVVCIAELFLVGVLEVVRVEPALREQVPHEPGSPV